MSKKGRPKGTTAIVLQRQREVMEKLLDGSSHSQIQEYIQKNYGIQHGQVEKDIQACYKIIESDYTRETQQIISKHLSMYYQHRQIALETGQVSAANQSLQAIEKLLGMLKPDNQVNVQNNSINADLSHLNVDELKELLKLENGNT